MPEIIYPGFSGIRVSLPARPFFDIIWDMNITRRNFIGALPRNEGKAKRVIRREA